jgi:hypothetical protein
MTFAAKLRANLAGKNKHFDFDKKSVTGDFIVDHYAGDVQYTCTKFLDKNRDSLSMGEHQPDAVHKPRQQHTAHALCPSSICPSPAFHDQVHEERGS